MYRPKRYSPCRHRSGLWTLPRQRSMGALWTHAESAWWWKPATARAVRCRAALRPRSRRDQPDAARRGARRSRPEHGQRVALGQRDPGPRCGLPHRSRPRDRGGHPVTTPGLPPRGRGVCRSSHRRRPTSPGPTAQPPARPLPRADREPATGRAVVSAWPWPAENAPPPGREGGQRPRFSDWLNSPRVDASVPGNGVGGGPRRGARWRFRRPRVQRCRR